MIGKDNGEDEPAELEPPAESQDRADGSDNGE
jgi:hypothetical protein